MTEFSVQFDVPEFQPEFFSGPTLLRYYVKQSGEQDDQNLIERQKANDALLLNINEALTQITVSLKGYQEEVGAVALHFAETFARTVFCADEQLVIEKLKTHLNNGLAGIDLSVGIIVWVHSDHVPFVEQFCTAGFDGQIAVQPDDLLKASECRIEGPDIGLIARIENQLDTCLQTMFEKPEGGNDDDQ